MCLAVSVSDEQIARKFAQYFLEDTIRLGIDLGQAINKCTGQSEHFYLEDSDVTSRLLFIHDLLSDNADDTLDADHSGGDVFKHSDRKKVLESFMEYDNKSTGECSIY